MLATDELIERKTLELLTDNAERADSDLAWPEPSWQVLTEAGVLSWSIPRAFGGRELAPVDLLRGYEALAGACLTTVFILSQREAAVRRVIAYGSQAQQQRLLPLLSEGKSFMTVGLSQLTTSRQHGPPSLTATALDGEWYRLDGVSPWVTAADAADEIVLGAVLADGRQLLAMVPRNAAGLGIDPPLPLTALRGSRTAPVRCSGVIVEREQILTGPAVQILAAGKGGVGGVETSCLALGLAKAAIGFVERESTKRPDLADGAARFVRAAQKLRERLDRYAGIEASPADLMALRVDCTLLALRATQVALTAAKGAGFLITHPVQRWARQALFFLVWSCPRPAAEGILNQLLPDA